MAFAVCVASATFCCDGKLQMLVLKFGGTAVADAEPIERTAAIVARAERPCVVIVSALAGVTDRLLQIARLAEAGRVAAACGILERVADRHRRLARAWTGGAADALEIIERAREEVEALVHGASVLRNASPAARDAIAAAGEVMGSRLLAVALADYGVAATWIDARRVFVTDGEHGSAAPLLDRTATRLDEHVRPLLSAGRVPVLAGFIGATPDGVTTTLGRGASDLSAAIVGSHFGAREIQIWTDADGLLTADPRLVPHARLVPQLSYAEARDLTYFGATVLHPAAIEPAGARGIPVRILNARRPDSDGTLVNGTADRRAPAALAYKRGLTVLEIASRHELRPPMFLRRVFEAFDRSSLHPCLTTTADSRVLAAFEEARRVGEVATAIERSANVTIRTDMALLSVVGDSLRATPRLAADLLAALEGVTVYGVAQPPSGMSLTVLVEDADLPDVMRRVYDRFYPPAEGTPS